MGPVGDISMLEYNGSGALAKSDAALPNWNDESFVGTDIDVSRGWPFIPGVKQKPPQKDWLLHEHSVGSGTSKT